MFKTMRMSVKLTLLVVAMLLLTGVIGFSGLYNMSLAKDRLDTSLTSMHHMLQLTAGLDDSNVEFKKQVQAFKDLLLRGSETKDFDNYQAAFRKQEGVVQEYF